MSPISIPNGNYPIKDGSLVYWRERQENGNSRTPKFKLIPYIISDIYHLYEKVNLDSNRGRYAFSLIDPNTNSYMLDKNGQPRVFVVDDVVSKGIVVFPPSASHEICPYCQNGFVLESSGMCESCEKAERLRRLEEMWRLEEQQRREEEQLRKAALQRREEERRREEELRRKEELRLREEKRRFLEEQERRRIAKKRFFEDRIRLGGKPFVLDDEQIDAVLADRHAIITARAGSGKTRVLTAKLIDLLVNQQIRPDEVRAFCFNRDAAEEIRRRLNSDCTIDGKPFGEDLDVVHTFHAFSKAVLGEECGRIIVDDASQARSQLVKKIIGDLRKKAEFEKELRTYFLSDTLKVDRKKFVSAEHYYRFIRNSRYRTLKGEHVKSIAEKIIADFLFEHGIKYRYERHFYLSKVDSTPLSEDDRVAYLKFPRKSKETVPDFHLEDHDIVWEHWGITGNETAREIENFTKAVGNYQEYQATMAWKRSFWRKWRFKLTPARPFRYDFKHVKEFIETDPASIDIEKATREEIEGKLKRLLESHGVKCVKRSEKDIIEDVWKNAHDHFTGLIIQFIDKFQQQYLGHEDQFISAARAVENEREKAFLRLGYMVYKEYVNILANGSSQYSEYTEFKLDFNQCLHLAAQKIRSGEYDHSILQLKWILIDEYQDFSELFFNLITAILSRNSRIKLFCVGDDWQAINHFAGSDLKFFLNFGTYFQHSLSYTIGTNYRCENHIVEKAGQFMKFFGIPGQPQKGFLKNTGESKELPIDPAKFDVEISDYEWLVSEGGAWADSDNIDKLTVQAYMKIISSIINNNPGKKIMILHRKSSFLGKRLDEIEGILRNSKLCKFPSPDIHVKTVHRSKGEEADIVILAEVNENCFPIYHPDNILFGIFGENESTSMEDEARLYYVALTRAKHSIYILYSQDVPSCFVTPFIPHRWSNKPYQDLSKILS